MKHYSPVKLAGGGDAGGCVCAEQEVKCDYKSEDRAGDLMEFVAE